MRSPMNSVRLDLPILAGCGFVRGLRRRLGAGAVAIGIATILLCSSAAQANGNGNSGIKRQAGGSRAGLSFVDLELPLDFVARMGGLYTRYRYAIDAMAYNRHLSPGPAIQRDSLIESRISLGRRIADGIELEVAWATQSEFSFTSMPGTPRQIVGAFVRFTH